MPTTLDRLQALVDPRLPMLHRMKPDLPRITCADGTHFKPGASSYGGSIPAKDEGPYTHIAVYGVRDVFGWDEYDPSYEERVGKLLYKADALRVPRGEYGYWEVPIELVAQFIDKHGGFNEGADECPLPTLFGCNA